MNNKKTKTTRNWREIIVKIVEQKRISIGEQIKEENQANQGTQRTQ